MQRIKSRIFAALLLVGVCVLSVTSVVNALDVEVDFTSTGFTDDNPHFEWVTKNEETLTASCYIWGYFYIEDGDDEDDEPDLVGSISAEGAAWINADGSLTLFSYAYSQLYGSNITGRANAWIKFPREPSIPHPDGPGAVDIGKGTDKTSVQIYDTRTYQPWNNVGWGKLQGSASLQVPGINRITVKYVAKAVP